MLMNGRSKTVTGRGISREYRDTLPPTSFVCACVLLWELMSQNGFNLLYSWDFFVNFQTIETV